MSFTGSLLLRRAGVRRAHPVLYFPCKELNMGRRIALAALLSTIALAACSDVSAPRRDDPYSDGNGGCRSGYIMGAGHTCEPDNGHGV